MQTGLLSRLMGRPAEVKTLPVTIRYVPSSLRWELAKGATGSVGGLAILLGLSPSPWIGVPVGIATVLFGAYAVQQLRRSRIEIEVTEERAALREKERVRAIPWGSLDGMKLKFYAFGRKAEQGTLVLTIEGGGQKIKLDSAADQFATLLFYAAQMARTRELALDPTTLSNMQQLGL